MNMSDLLALANSSVGSESVDGGYNASGGGFSGAPGE